MNYRELVLKLLKKRPSVVVVEDVILADFANHADPVAAFEKWCTLYHIEIIRTPGEPSIVLQKKTK